MFPVSARTRSIKCPLTNCQNNFCYFSHGYFNNSDLFERNVRNASTQTTAIAAKRFSSSISNSAVENNISKKLKANSAEREAPAINLERNFVPVPPIKESPHPKSSRLVITNLVSSSQPPKVSPDINSYIARDLRQKAVDSYFKQFQRIYQNVLSSSPLLAHSHALQQEESVLRRSNVKTYANNKVSVYRRLLQREPAISLDDVGIDGEYQKLITANESSAVKSSDIVFDLMSGKAVY